MPSNIQSAVLKYMAQDGCDRKEAQGNMDAFLDNPQVSRRVVASLRVI